MDRLFWMRVILAVIAGTAATLMFESIEDVEEKRWTSIGFMIIVFIGTVIVAKMMRIRLASSDRKKLVTNGLGSFVFLYLFVWILSYTLVYSVGRGGGIVTPIT
jgi:H+/Cl- antiporter ClcA